MTDYYDKMKAWKNLMKTLEGIPDPSLRKLYKDTFILKAQEDWGFNPETLKKAPPTENNKPQLSDWEQRLVDRIQTMIDYGIDPQTEEEKKELENNLKEAKKNMYFFIKGGGTLVDIPKEIRTDAVVDLYFEMLKKVYDV